MSVAGDANGRVEAFGKELFSLLPLEGFFTVESSWLQAVTLPVLFSISFAGFCLRRLFTRQRLRVRESAHC